MYRGYDYLSVSGEAHHFVELLVRHNPDFLDAVAMRVRTELLFRHPERSRPMNVAPVLSYTHTLVASLHDDDGTNVTLVLLVAVVGLWLRHDK